jgi:ceramide glucosyltransferase
MTLWLGALYAVLVVARLALARRERSHGNRPSTIVQPILSGDPLLEQTLAANLRAHPEAAFLWLIDDDDHEAQRIAAALAPLHARLRILTGPGPRDGDNPKLAKLERALALVETERLIVLDDDTFLPHDSQLPAAALATGLPVFTAKGSLYERLTGGFVNGNALLTYPSAWRLGLQRTINGMIYSVDAAQLRALGGFAAAGHELTDDYAVARLYLRSGFAITQTTTPAHVAMTIASFGHYARVMRRWMIFASHYLRGNISPATIFWILLPGLLPLAGLAAAVAEAHAAAWLGLLLTKALVNRVALWRITRVRSTLADLCFEAAADLATPLWSALAMIRPSRLQWRTRRIELESGAIRYK